MVTITLPDLPEGREFEELISAYFQIGGYYIERNIIERRSEEILEIDLILTNYCGDIPEIYLVEAKSKSWGYADVFKVRGWMDYLKQQKGIFITKQEKTDRENVSNLGKKLSIDIISNPNVAQIRNLLKRYFIRNNYNSRDLAFWRFSYWIERQLEKKLKKEKKNHLDLKRYIALDKYYFDVKNKLFFTENTIEKIRELYKCYETYPHISAKCGNEVLGNNFNDDINNLPNEIFNETYYKCELTDISISTYIEYYARLTILKSAVDYLIYKEQGDMSKAKDYFKIGRQEVSTLDFLPSTFTEGLKELSKHKYYKLYPVFWQWFLWYFGGFILLDYEKQDFEFLAEKTGLCVDQIPLALEAFDILFPNENSGWLMDLSGYGINIKILKMFSTPFIGLGATVRRYYYSDNSSWENLKLSGKYTLRDLQK